MDTPSTLEEPERGAAAHLLTIAQAGAYAPALGERSLRHLVDQRRIPIVRIGRRRYIDRRDLDAFVESCRQPAAGSPR